MRGGAWGFERGGMGERGVYVCLWVGGLFFWGGGGVEAVSSLGVTTAQLKGVQCGLCVCFFGEGGEEGWGRGKSEPREGANRGRGELGGVGCFAKLGTETTRHRLCLRL